MVLLVPSGVQLCDPMTAACQAPLSMKSPRHECGGRLPFPTPGDLPDLGPESASLESPELAGPLTPPERFLLSQNSHP